MQYPIYTAIPIQIVATVLTVYGIETLRSDRYQQLFQHNVAIVLTVYGIET